MSREKMSRLLSQKEFMESIVKLNTKEEVKAEFSKNGVDISDEELEAIREVIASKLGKGGNERISEKELDEVVGGRLGDGAKTALAIGLGLLIGSGTGVGGYFLYKKLKN